MEHTEFTAVHTPLGLVYGRDAIYVDKLDYHLDQRELIIQGELNGSLCSESTSDDFIPYRLICSGVYFFQTTELDLYDERQLSSLSVRSDWVEYTSSSLLNGASKSAKPALKNLRHFILLTYDDVFEIGCTAYKMEIGASMNK